MRRSEWWRIARSLQLLFLSWRLRGSKYDKIVIDHIIAAQRGQNVSSAYFWRGILLRVKDLYVWRSLSWINRRKLCIFPGLIPHYLGLNRQLNSAHIDRSFPFSSNSLVNRQMLPSIFNEYDPLRSLSLCLFILGLLGSTGDWTDNHLLGLRFDSRFILLLCWWISYNSWRMLVASCDFMAYVLFRDKLWQVSFHSIQNFRIFCCCWPFTCLATKFSITTSHTRILCKTMLLYRLIISVMLISFKFIIRVVMLSRLVVRRPMRRLLVRTCNIQMIKVVLTHYLFRSASSIFSVVSFTHSSLLWI